MNTSCLYYKIEEAICGKTSKLNLNHDNLVALPTNIESISHLTQLYIGSNRLTSLPENIGNLSNLAYFYASHNQLASLPDSISNLSNLKRLYLDNNNLTSLPDNIGDLSGLADLNLENNQISYLPESITRLSELVRLNINKNPLVDLSVLQDLPDLSILIFANVNLPRQYWTKLSEWKPRWLLSERNAEIRRLLIEHVGYEKICEELNPVAIDIWREYSLLRIDVLEPDSLSQQDIIDFRSLNSMMLLKMTCPSTKHIHILRVPPQMTSAEEAITWINHGIHPNLFTVQT